MPRSSQHARRGKGRTGVRYRAAEVERLIIALVVAALKTGALTLDDVRREEAA
jgi:hypothetical protein